MNVRFLSLLIMLQMLACLHALAGESTEQLEIVPGTTIVIDQWNSKSTWTIRVSHAVDGALLGVADKVNHSWRFGYRNQPGTLTFAELKHDNEDLSIRLSTFDLNTEQDRLVAQFRGNIENGNWKFTPVPEIKDVLHGKVVYDGTISKGSDSKENRQLWDQSRVAQERAKQEWATLRPRLERLKTRGHLISDRYITTDGMVSWTWTNEISVNYEMVGIPDYSLLADLAEFQHIPCIRLDGKFPPNVLNHLKGIKSIGLLTIDCRHGIDTSTFSDVRTVINTLILLEADQPMVNFLRPIPGLETFELHLRWVAEQAHIRYNTAPIGRMTGLRNLCINIAALESPGNAEWLANIKHLRSLELSTELDRSSLMAIQQLGELEHLECGIETVEDLPLITNPRLKTLVLHGSYEHPITDELLKSWELPATLSVVRLPKYWLPVPLPEYHNRLPEMTGGELAIYANVRLLPEMKSGVARLESLRPLVIYNGGALISSAGPGPNGQIARERVQSLLDYLNSQQVTIESAIPQLAKATLLATKDLEAAKRIPTKNANAVYAAIAPYYDKSDADVWEAIRPKHTRHRNAEADQFLRDSIAAMGDLERLENAAAIRINWEDEVRTGRLRTRAVITMIPSKSQYHEVDSTVDFNTGGFKEGLSVICDGQTRVELFEGRLRSSGSKSRLDFHWTRQTVVPLMLAELLKGDWQLQRVSGPLLDGKLVETVHVFSHDKLVGEFQFDLGSKLLLQRTHFIPSAFLDSEKDIVESRRTYHDYEKTGDYLLPQSYTESEGTPTARDARTRMKDFAILDAAPDKMFEIPIIR